MTTAFIFETFGRPVVPVCAIPFETSTANSLCAAQADNLKQVGKLKNPSLVILGKTVNFDSLIYII